MTDFLIVVGEESASVHGVASYSVGPEGLTRLSSISLGGDVWKSNGVAIAPDGKKAYLSAVETSSNFTKIATVDLDESGNLSNFQTVADVSSSSGGASKLQIRGEKLFLIDESDGSIQMWDISASPPTQLAKLVPSTGSSSRDLILNDDASQIAVPVNGSSFVVMDVGESTLTEVASSALDDAFTGAHVSGNFWAIGGGTQPGDVVSLVEVNGGVVSIIDTASSGGNGGEIRAGVPGTLVSPARIHNVSASAITVESTHDWGPTRSVSVSSDGLFAATTAAATTSGLLDLWSASDWSTKVDGLSGVVGGRTFETAFSPGEFGPRTDEEVFQATYATASAQPPRVMALTQPLDTQRAIDTEVSNLLINPKEFEVTAPLEVGELQYLQFGQPFFVQDDQPGLRDGKILLLQEFDMPDLNPGVPITFQFWGAS